MAFALTLIGIALVVAIATFFLHKIHVRWIKYIPALLMLLITILMIMMAQSGTGESMQDLAWIVVAIITFAGMVGGVVTAVLLDLLQYKRVRRDK